jgi:hypothetical protein
MASRNLQMPLSIGKSHHPGSQNNDPPSPHSHASKLTMGMISSLLKPLSPQ